MHLEGVEVFSQQRHFFSTGYAVVAVAQSPVESTACRVVLDDVGELVLADRVRACAHVDVSRSGTPEALTRNGIPFQPSNTGLFIFVDLSQWVDSFSGDEGEGSELNLCQYLIEHGVCLNPREVSKTRLWDVLIAPRQLETDFPRQYAGSHRPGWFRFVFTEMPEANILAVERIRKAVDLLPKICSDEPVDGRCSIDTTTTSRGELGGIDDTKMGVNPDSAGHLIDKDDPEASLHIMKQWIRGEVPVQA